MRRGPGVASLTLVLVIVLAAAALAYGALHDGSKPHGFGSANDRAAARRTLILLSAPGLAVDKTATACGNTADACFTGKGNVTETLTALASALHTAGGNLRSTCGPLPADVTDATGYNCWVEGRLGGAWLSVLVGDGWLLPSHGAGSRPRSAALVDVESKAADLPPAVTASLPAEPPDARLYVPPTWLAPTDACISLPNGPALAATGSTQPSPAPAANCPAHTASIRVATPGTIVAASNELAQVALKAGFRIDGLPCAKDSRPSACHFVAERRGSSSGALLHERLETTLGGLDDGGVGGTLTLIDLT
jgi:hypothetical protein